MAVGRMERVEDIMLMNGGWVELNVRVMEL